MLHGVDKESADLTYNLKRERERYIRKRELEKAEEKKSGIKRLKGRGETSKEKVSEKGRKQERLRETETEGGRKRGERKGERGKEREGEGDREREQAKQALIFLPSSSFPISFLSPV